MTQRFDNVFDTTAVLAILLGEPDRVAAVKILRQARDGGRSLAIPFITLMETEYQLVRRFTPEDASTSMLTVRAWPASIIHSNDEWSHEAALVKSRGGLSLADAWIASLALILDAELVHKDKEFDAVPGLRSVRL